jgi:iron complex transport system ATP-binding protein
MHTRAEKILTIESLKIGYKSGRNEILLLPPVTASALNGELIAVIGRNGIGKSTLLRTLTGIQPALGGEIWYSGKNISEYSRMELAQKVGYISTESVKVSNMSVYDLVALGRFPHTNWAGRIDNENHNSIMNALERTGMTSYYKRLISELSDGERQKAMISRILAQDTGIMIMDEPTAFLDTGSKFEILHLMHLLSMKNDRCIIFSTHDLQMAINQADKIWLLTDKNLIEGSPEDLMISGAFDHLFESSFVRFNSEFGFYSIRSEEMGSIYIDGNGIKRHWTEKAINRAGYKVAEFKTTPYIKIPSSEINHWQFIDHSSVQEYDSIYELISWLRKQNQSLI